ncbi:MAG: carbon storage regulator CsrA [Gammaproteobacteria bacterium]
MLILTRRPAESLYIGDEITVTVLGVVGNQVRLGIEAPRHIVVDRGEIHERKKRAALAYDDPAPGNEAQTAAIHEDDRQEPNGNVASPEPRR